MKETDRRPIPAGANHAADYSPVVGSTPASAEPAGPGPAALAHRSEAGDPDSEVHAAVRLERRKSEELAALLRRSEQELSEHRDRIQELSAANADLATLEAAIDYRVRHLEQQLSERERQLAERSQVAAAEERAEESAERARLRFEIDRLRAERVARDEDPPPALISPPPPLSVPMPVPRRAWRGLVPLAFLAACVGWPLLPVGRETLSTVEASAEPPVEIASVSKDVVVVPEPPVPAAPVEDVSADEHARRAEELFAAGDLEAAARAAEAATEVDPMSAHHHRLSGYIHAALGADREATREFELAAAIEPSLRVSVADYHLVRAWVDLEEEAHRRPTDAALADRLRALAAVAELNPELRAMSRIAAPHRPLPVAEFIPPLVLQREGDSALVVEMRTQTARLYGLRGGHLVVVASYPVTTGQAMGAKQKRGDLRTPDGVYAVTDLLPGKALPDRYGALAMPLSYPNAWDKAQNRGGDGIWIHGADTLIAPFSPRGTRGCVTLRAEDLREVARSVDPVITPVLLAEEIHYVRLREWRDTSRKLLEKISGEGLLNLVATPNYIVAARRDRDTVIRDFYQPVEPFEKLATERAAVVSAAACAAKLTKTQPATTASLVGVQISKDDPSRAVVIETSGPAQVKSFANDTDGNRLFIDLLGVRPGLLPEAVAGTGDWVRQVRIAAAGNDPPTIRLVVEMNQAAKHRIASVGNRTIVSLSAAD